MARIAFLVVFIITTAAVSSAAATDSALLRGGVLTVNGKPFFPLATWSDMRISPEELQEMGMNVDFWGIGPSPDGPARLQERVAKSIQKGILCVPYFGFGGAGVTPWRKEDLESYLKPLATSPGILGWYIGDDLTEVHLPGMSATADTVHANDRTHPVVADYIAEPGAQGQAVFRPYLDIMCQYTYPLPDHTLQSYSDFFDQQRVAVGDPLWTWVQAFMWEFTGKELRLGSEGAGPIPEPEQVRLLTYVALNRGVRGILFFAVQHFRPQVEIKAEVAMLCREIRLLEPYLAAGKLTRDLAISDPLVRASSFNLPQGTAAALVVMGPSYHRWVDEGIRENVSFTAHCPGDAPRAVLACLPQPVECPVQVLGRGKVRVTVPRLELAGLVLVTCDRREIQRVKREAARLAAQVAPLAVEGAAAQFRKVAGAFWSLGQNPVGGDALLADGACALGEAHRALAAGRHALAIERARDALRPCRQLIDRAMRLAESRRQTLSESDQVNLKVFYSLSHIPKLLAPPLDESEHRFLREFAVIGPFPLEMTQESDDIVPAGFERAYPPEEQTDFSATYQGLAGPVRWQFARTDLDAVLDFRRLLQPSKNAVVYARALIIAPRDIETVIGLGSNDGARLWVSGALVFSLHKGRHLAANRTLHPVALHAGANPVLVKVENYGGAWELMLSVRDPDKVLRFAAQ